MTCINPNQERCGYRRDGWEPNQCFRLGGPPFKCQREGQTTPPATQESSEPEIVAQATAREPEPTFEEATQQVLRAIRWMKRDMDFRREQTGLDGDALSPEMQDVCRLISEMEAGTLNVTRIRQH